MSNTPEDLKVAIVCDWLTGIGGAERVILELHRMFPEAPIYTSQYDESKIDWFKDADVRTGWLQKLPVSLKKFLPLFRAIYFSRLDLSSYDIVISDAGAESKGIKFGENTRHICICNAPTHYYWSRYEQYIEEPGFGKLNWLARIGLKILVGPLRKWDYRAAQKPTELIAISTHIKNEIKKYYDRDSEVIFPPVDLARFEKTKPIKKEDYFIITGRQTPYKRIDLAVQACTNLKLPLVVIGNGPEHQKLTELAGKNVKFVTDASDSDVADYLRKAKAFIFPGLDDFGISPVEALASGTPVIAYKAGGALDYVKPGITGEFFDKQTTESLETALAEFNPSLYSREKIIQESARFSISKFKDRLMSKIAD
jgi:glycosyltransferase involved in cell wall biosynthesis